jgi:hypothetical protein
VSDPQNKVADLSVNKIVFGKREIFAGANITFKIFVENRGPDDAATVQLSDDVPSGATFLSGTQNSGPAFVCTNPAPGGNGTSLCTIASLPAGSKSEFTFAYQTDPGASVGQEITNEVSISSTTADRNTRDNSSADSVVVAEVPTCSITVPNDITVDNDPGQGGAVVNYAPATGTPICGAVSCNPESGKEFPIGTTAVVCTDENFTARESFNVTVNDIEDPVITCPANITVTESVPGSGEAVVTYNPTATDNGPVTVTSSPASGSTFTIANSPHTVTATATDAGGRTDSCTFTVTVVASNCSISCPANISQTKDANENGAFVTYPDATTTGDCGAVSYSLPSGSFFPVGTTTVTATSEAGASCQFSVTIFDDVDTSPPVISCPANIIVPAAANSCEASVNPGTATATDDRPGVVVVQGARSDGAALNAPYRGEVIITWTATDAAGNTAECQQSVQVTENTPPVVSTPAARTISVGESCEAEVPNYIASLVATDNCTPSTQLEITQSPAAENLVGPGTYTVTITVKDISENTTTVTTTLTVVDNTLPTITAPGDVSANADSVSCAVSVPLGDATAADNCTFTVTNDAPATFSPGQTTVTWTVTDASGNTATDTQLVTVVDNTAPTIALNGGANPQVVECHTSYTELGATASDNCDGSFAATPSGSVDVDVPGSYTITYNATDAAGNAATPVTRTVNVVDTIAPTISGVSDVSAATGAGATTCGAFVSDAQLGTASATDSCAGPVSVTRTGVPAGNVFPIGSTIVTYTATDPSGNSTTKTQTVTVTDNTPPTVNVPANIVVTLPSNSTATSMVVNYAVTASDNCPGAVTLAVSPASGSVFSVGTTTVTATATDAHGNTRTRTFNVTVLYNFTGFFSPVSNLPVLNVVNAGRAIPVKFSLSGNKGLNIFEVDFPASAQVACGSNATVDLEETVTAGSSSLSYSPDQYNYVWKTESSWAGTCRQLVVKLNDGSEHRANFKFK